MSVVQTTVPACRSIPVVPAFTPGDWDATAQAMQAGAWLEFAQNWRPQPDPDFQPGRVSLGVIGEELAVYAVLRDDRPANRATRLNEPTWTTGDVLELFFQAEGRPGYFEFHVTPENQRLQLFFPSRAAYLEHRNYAHWAIAESRFTSAARVGADRTYWEAVMRIPLALVLDAPRADGSRRFKYCFSRYDYQPGRERPVTSSTCRLSNTDFHNMAEWDWAEAARVAT